MRLVLSKGVLLVLASVSITLVTTEIALRAVEYWKSVPAVISENELGMMTEARGTSWLPRSGAWRSGSARPAHKILGLFRERVAVSVKTFCGPV